MTGCTVRRYEQLETSPETFEQELRPAVCEHRQTDLRRIIVSIDGRQCENLRRIIVSIDGRQCENLRRIIV